MRIRFILLHFIFFLLLFAFSFSIHAVEIVCHRGANEYAPENTRAATQLCIDWGMEYVEIDVRTSKDGVMYLLHDSTVNRTTDGGRVRLRDLTSDQIDRLDAGSWFDPKFSGEPVPRLEPFLRWLKGKIKIYFDVKDADLKRLIQMVYDIGLENNCFFWFGNQNHALEFRQLDKKLSLKINARTPEDVHMAKKKFDAQIIETGLDNATPEMIEACRQHDMKLMIIHMKKDKDAFRKIIALGTDMVNLDHGNVFRQVEREVAESQLIDIYDPESYKLRKPILILHRGGVIADDAPECSLRAIELAAEEKYEMVELDIRESKDHVPIQFHDNDMKKACGIDSTIEELTVDEITKIKFLGSDQYISTLADALVLCEKHKLGVMLDIKTDGTDQYYQTMADLLKKHGLEKSTVSICTYPSAMQHLKGLAMPCLTKEEKQKIEAGESLNLTGKFWFGWPREITNEQVKKYQQAGALVIPSINTFHYPEGCPYSAKSDIERMKEAGVDMYQIDSVYKKHFSK